MGLRVRPIRPPTGALTLSLLAGAQVVLAKSRAGGGLTREKGWLRSARGAMRSPSQPLMASNATTMSRASSAVQATTASGVLEILRVRLDGRGQRSRMARDGSQPTTGWGAVMAPFQVVRDRQSQATVQGSAKAEGPVALMRAPCRQGGGAPLRRVTLSQTKPTRAPRADACPGGERPRPVAGGCAFGPAAAAHGVTHRAAVCRSQAGVGFGGFRCADARALACRSEGPRLRSPPGDVRWEGPRADRSVDIRG